MKILIWFWIAILYGISYLPFWVLHRFSDVTYFFIYGIVGYRKKVVRENLAIAFSSLSTEERLKIEKQFFRNFCDLIFEAIKTFSISQSELKKRCEFTTPELIENLWQKKVNIMGVSSHLANWEWKGLSLGFVFKQRVYAVFKPLSSGYLNHLVVRSRERFGSRFVSFKKLREALKSETQGPYIVGLLSDQAPHDYSKAFEVEFFGKKTWVTPGAGVLTVQKNYTPVWGWNRRTGRSTYTWGVEVLNPVLPEKWSDSDLLQIVRISKAHHLSEDQAAYALALTQLFTAKLEQEIKMAPQDWLWSHRRWKLR